MTIVQIAAFLFLIHCALKTQRDPDLMRARSRCNSR